MDHIMESRVDADGFFKSDRAPDGLITHREAADNAPQETGRGGRSSGLSGAAHVQDFVNATMV